MRAAHTKGEFFLKKLVLVALAAMALAGAGASAAVADDPVGGLQNSTGCGIHLDNHGGSTPFYKSDGNGGWTACTVDDAKP